MKKSNFSDNLKDDRLTDYLKPSLNSSIEE